MSISSKIYVEVNDDHEANKSYETNDREQKNDEAINGRSYEDSMESGAKDSHNSNDGEQQNDKATDHRDNEDSMESSRTVSVYNSVLWNLSLLCHVEM